MRRSLLKVHSLLIQPAFRSKKGLFICLFWSTLLSHAQVSINSTGASPHPSAALDVNYTSLGFLPPRMTESERNAISDPAVGLQIFNTTTQCLEFYVNGVWQPIACGCTGPPASPVSGIHTPHENAIHWNWNEVPGATGYRYSLSNDFGSATESGTSFQQTGLACGNASNTLYVWSYNACGNSSVLILEESTLDCVFVTCGDEITVHHLAGWVSPVSKSVNYGSVNHDGRCWTDRNLGADVAASSATDNSEPAAGWLWQFNKKQGYEVDGLMRTPNTAWITPVVESSAWMSENDPCTIEMGSGWRIPTYSELNSADGSWANITDGYASSLKLHLAGNIEVSGAFSNRGVFGGLWSSTSFDNTRAWILAMADSYSNMYNGGDRAYGFSLRCLRN